VCTAGTERYDAGWRQLAHAAHELVLRGTTAYHNAKLAAMPVAMQISSQLWAAVLRARAPAGGTDIMPVSNTPTRLLMVPPDPDDVVEEAEEAIEEGLLERAIEDGVRDKEAGPRVGQPAAVRLGQPPHELDMELDRATDS
jgi:hypothetical protein